MIMKTGAKVIRPRGPRRWSGRLLTVMGAVGLAAASGECPGWGSEPDQSSQTPVQATVASPRNDRGPRPLLVAMDDRSEASPDIEQRLDRQVLPAGGGRDSDESEKEKTHPAQVASTVGRSLSPGLSLEPPAPAASIANDPVTQAKQAVAACQARYSEIQDYTCTFYKKERINGKLLAPHVMSMKARTKPNSVYFKFVWPKKGREAIYVAGRNKDKIVAHDVGLGRFVAGTMHLDPRGSMAMEDNRHPVTEAGIGTLISSVAHHWARELTAEESKVTIYSKVHVGDRPCTMIESVHTEKHPDYLFHMVKLYIDHEHGLPIRFEAFDWPKHPGAAPELMEEYTYANLRVNVGLRDLDFDPANTQYSYGRF